jgi:hypothetical protein
MSSYVTSYENTYLSPEGTPVEVSAGNRSLIFVVLFTILFIVIILLILYSVHDNTAMPQPLTPATASPNLINYTVNAGASVDGIYAVSNGTALTTPIQCTKTATAQWITNYCQCIVPFYGAQCNLESQNLTYLAAGVPPAGSLLLPPTQTIITDRLSFDFANNPNVQTHCTDQCDANDDCVGVLWQEPPPLSYGTATTSGVCTLLLNDVLVNPGQNLPYDPTIQSSLYFKSGNAPQFTDRVFVYYGTLPPRYWVGDMLVNGSSIVQTLYPNQLYTLFYYPQYQVNNAFLTGVISNQPFNISQLSQIIAGGTTSVYAIQPASNPIFQYPVTWAPPFYVAFGN